MEEEAGTHVRIMVMYTFIVIGARAACTRAVYAVYALSSLDTEEYLLPF